MVLKMLGIADKAGAAGFGVSAAVGLLLLTEMGVPIPIPGDLLMLLVGERTGAGAFPLWLAIAALELVALLPTAVLFLAVRGPGHAVVKRVGPRVGLTEDRIKRASTYIESRGSSALFVGRATPGLRTLTVAAAAASGLSAARALPPLWAGSTLFVQGHLALGILLGPLARTAIERARGPILLVLVGLLVVGVVLWLIRRGRRSGYQAWTEASCPACLLLGIPAARMGADRPSS